MSNKIQPFKLSQLDRIGKIDHDDLFLVSDYEGGSCYTRKMDVGQFLNQVASDSIISQAVKNKKTGIGKAIGDVISADVGKMIEDEVHRYIEQNLSAAVLAVICANYALVDDMMDGSIDEQRIIDGSAGGI